MEGSYYPSFTLSWRGCTWATVLGTPRGMLKHWSMYTGVTQLVGGLQYREKYCQRKLRELGFFILVKRMLKHGAKLLLMRDDRKVSPGQKLWLAGFTLDIGKTFLKSRVMQYWKQRRWKMKS